MSYSVPLPRQDWIGLQLINSFLRTRHKVTSHLPCFCLGLKSIPRQQRCAASREIRLRTGLEALALVGELGIKEIFRLQQAQLRLEQKLRGRRSSSHLPALVALLIARPIVSATMITQDLKISHRAALNLIAELNVKELTGRGRFQAWGVL